ncbi:hypothetical protein FACS1894104_2020 [Actinomycetota bacterium]|nr:hypothetical protein FACS1894104_2020 [Actinomycetota bacterium]
MAEVAEQTMVVLVRVTEEVFRALPGLSKIITPVAKLLGVGPRAIKNAVAPAQSIKAIKKNGIETDVIDIPAGELKAMQKYLRGYRVDFGVSKDKATGDYELLFKAKDIRLVEKAMTKAIARYGSETDIATAGQVGICNDTDFEKNNNYPYINNTSPATDRQVEFIEALAERGVISTAEVKEFYKNPKVMSANKLLDKHKNHAGDIDQEGKYKQTEAHNSNYQTKTQSRSQKTIQEKVRAAKKRQAEKAAVAAIDPAKKISKAKQVDLSR